MLEWHKDRGTALRVFATIFKEEDKKDRRQLLSFFLKGYGKMYAPNIFEINNRNLPLTHYFICANEIIIKAQSKNNEEKAFDLGKVLGIFLAAVGHGILRWKSSDKEDTEGEILANVKSISQELGELEKEAGKYIERRIKRVAQTNRQKLIPVQKRLLAAIAAQFS